MLTDRGSCFTADAFEAACERPGVQHRKTKPYTFRTNGMVERFNGRVQREVPGITLYSHRDLETVLAGFIAAYNGRHRRVLNELSPEMLLRQRLEADPVLCNPGHGPSSPAVIIRVLRIVADVKEVSHPDIRPYSGLALDIAQSRVHAREPCLEAEEQILGPSRFLTADDQQRDELPLPLAHDRKRGNLLGHEDALLRMCVENRHERSFSISRLGEEA